MRWTTSGLRCDSPQRGGPTFSPRTESALDANAGVQDIYDDYIRLACDLHATTNDFRFVLSSWEAAEGNRSSSLREAIAASSGWRSRLPNAYWFKLAAFRQQLVEHSRSAGGETARGTGELNPS